jgi:hypothetical protein
MSPKPRKSHELQQQRRRRWGVLGHCGSDLGVGAGRLYVSSSWRPGGESWGCSKVLLLWAWTLSKWPCPQEVVRNFSESIEKNLPEWRGRQYNWRARERMTGTWKQRYCSGVRRQRPRQGTMVREVGTKADEPPVGPEGEKPLSQCYCRSFFSPEN